MAIVSGGRRWLWWALLATVACFAAATLVLLACGTHALRPNRASTDVGASSGSDATSLDREANAITTAIDTSSSPCSVVGGKYGACDTVLGWGFDGKVCRQRTGCDCTPDCAQLFPTAQQCAQTCRKAGKCNSEALIGHGIATFAIGGSCDSLLACVPAGLEEEVGLQLAGTCQPGGTCGDLQTCPLKVPGTIDQSLWDDYCRASLISGVRLECFQRLL
jgi:hypothetical protein